MKNIVNRALVAKKKQFLSKSVPRGIRTIWRYLGALFLMFTLSIGQMWGTDYTLYQATSSGVNTSNKTETGISVTFNSMKAVTNSPITSVANTTYGIEAGLKAPKWGGSGSGKNIKITVSENYTATVTAYVQVNTASQTVTVRPGEETADATVSVSCAVTETVYQVQASDLAAGDYYIKASDKVGLIKLVATVTSTGGGGGGDTEAPTLASSVPANSATDVAVSGNIVLTMSENVTIADASKFSISGGAGSLTTASIAASGKNVTIPYTGLANSTAYTLTVAANAIQDGAATPNKNEAFSISFTTAAPVVEPDYLLINQSNGDVNTAHFRTTSTSSSKAYSVAGTDFAKYIQLGGAYTSPVGFYETNKVIAYDAKTNSVTVDAWIYNKASSDYKFYISVIEEGAAAPNIYEYTATKNTGTKASRILSLSKNATIYLHVGNKSNVLVCQMGITENGTALLQGGQIGYKVNLTTSRLADNKSLLKMDGIEYNATSNAVKVLTSGNPLKLKNTTEYVKFTLPERTKVSIKATGTYSVTKTAEYSAGASMSGNQDVNLAADTWYICPNGSNVTFASLEFLTPDVANAVTYSAGEGSVKEGKSLPTQADAVAGEKFNLASGENLERSGYDFKGWKANGTGDLLLAGAEYTMGSAAVEFVAQWDVHVAKYGVKFMDGTTKLDSLSVTLGQAPVFADPTKALYTFAGWKDGGDNDVTLSDLATSVTVENTVVVLYAQWTKLYVAQGTEYVFEDAATVGTDPNSITVTTDNTANAIAANSRIDNMWLSAMSVKQEGGTYSGSGDDFKGWKINTASATIRFYVENDSRVTVTVGNLTSGLNITYTAKTADEEATTALTAKQANSYDVKGGTLVTLTTAGSSTVTLKGIAVNALPAVSDDATLSDLKVGGETVSGFAASTLNYYYELDYGETSYPAVTYTKHDEAASVVYQDASERSDDCSIVKVTAEDGVTINQYIIHFYYAPKYGVELIKATHNGTASGATVTGYIGGTVDKLTQPGGKLGSEDHYFGIQLANDEQFKAGDLVVIKASAISSTVELFDTKTFASQADSVNYLNKGNFDANSKMYTFTLTSNADKLYLYRTKTAKAQMNPTVEYIAVYRYMAPFIESFEVAGVAGTISGTAISVEVPNATDVTALTPTIQYWGNGGGAITPTGAQNFTDPVAYTVSSAYAEDATGDYAPVIYTVTVTKAAAIDHVNISGTLTVMEDNTTTLTATVIDTNDAEATNQNVTWTSDAAGVATVADGVVTGVAAGTAHITATSVEDGTKYATVEVTVTENLCRTWSNPASKETGATIGKMVVTPENIGTLQSNMTPYSGATATNAWKLDSKDTRYAEIKFTDNAQFESLTLGVSSNGSNKNYSFAVVCSSAAGDGFAAGVLSAATYEAVDNDEAENLVDVELPTGTKVVRVYRQYTYGSSTVGGGSSVFLYYINACKKELVALTAVAVADKSLAVGVSGAPSVTLTPANADVASYAWEIVSDETGEATINATTGAVSSASIGAVTVKVTATDELSNVIVSNIATINIVNKYEAVVPVTATTTWSWDALDLTGYTTDGPTIAAPDTVLANYFSGEEWQQIAGGVGGRPYRNTSNYKCFQGYTLYFETTVPGIVTLYAGRISNDQVVSVNGHAVGTVSSGKAYLSKIAVPAGKVYITSGSNGMRIYSMTFDTDLASYDVTDNVLDGYTRDVTEGRYGTICLENGGVMVGATLYEVAYYGETSKKIFFDEILNGTMEAGVPYIFLPNEGADKLAVFYTDEANESAKNANGLVGYIGASEDPSDAVPVPHNEGNYILNNNQYREVVYENSAYVLSHRAYIKLAAINPTEPALAPGRRRVALGVQSEQVATGCENLNVSDKPVKMVIDGQMYILRGEKMYDAKGQLVK